MTHEEDLLREADLILRTVEWRGSRTRGPRYCPQCDATASDGHKPECPLELLRDKLSHALSPFVKRGAFSPPQRNLK